MKKIILFILLFSTQFIVAQNKIETAPPESQSQDDNLIYSSAGIQEKPSFPGGMERFYAFFNSNLQMPDEEGLKGKIFVTFIIEKDGSLSDIKVLRDIGYGTGKEVIRVLKKSPKWISGKQNGKAVRVMYSLPFSIDNTIKSEPVNNKKIEPIQDKNAEKK